MGSERGLPVVTQADLGPIPFEEVGCHNCRPSCKYETLVEFEGREVVLCADRYLQAVDQVKGKKKSGPPVAVMIGLGGFVLMLAIAAIVTNIL